MSETLEELREAEYIERLEVTRLRRELYEDPLGNGSVYQTLAEAEGKLAQAEDARREAQKADARAGVILDSRHDDMLLGAQTTGLEVQLRLRMEHVPTAIAHLMSATEHPLVSCEIKNKGDHTRRLRITTFIDGYAARAVDTVELDAGSDHTFDQLPIMRSEQVRSVNELTRATLNVMIEDLDPKGTGVELHRSVPIWLLARTSAPLAVQDPATGAWRDMVPYFAAFATPNAPEVMSFLRKAAARHPDGQLIGYQGDESKVEPQVEAIFDALKEDAQITYVNSVLTSSPDEGFADQRVRVPRESLADKQANCIDGTVLYASLIEAASMNPAIVTVPGHAFVAWETWRGSEKWQYLETTMTGSHEFAEARASAEKTAAHYRAQNQLHEHSVRVLRSRDRITPME